VKKVLLSVIFMAVSHLCAAPSKDYLFLTGNAFVEGNWTEVLETGGEWKAIEPQNPVPDYFMSYAYFALNNIEKGYDCKSEFEKADPGAGKFLPVVEEMIRKQTDNSHLCALAGNAYIQAGKFDKALKMLKKAVKSDSVYGGVYFALGNVYSKKGESKKAASSYRKGIEKDPVFLPNYEQLGIYYYSSGERDRGEKIFKNGIKRSGGRSAFLYSRLGKIYLAGGQYDKAIEFLEESRKIKPEDMDSNLALGKAYTGSGMLNKAEKLYRKMLNAEWACCKSLIRGRLSDVIEMRKEQRAAK